MADAKLLAADGAWVGVLLALGWAGILRLRGTVLAGNLKLPFWTVFGGGDLVFSVVQ